MSPEELAAIKSSSDWRSTTGRLLAHIDQQAAQIEALKEKLIDERATRLYETTKALPGKFPDSPLGWTDKAHEQLKTEMPEVEWE